MSIHENDNFRGPEEKPSLSLEDRTKIKVNLTGTQDMMEDITGYNCSFSIENHLEKKQTITASLNKNGQIELHMPKEEDLKADFNIPTLKTKLKEKIEEWMSNDNQPEDLVNKNIPINKNVPEVVEKNEGNNSEELPKDWGLDNNEEKKPMDRETYNNMKSHCGHCGGDHLNHECPKVDKELDLNDE